MLAIHPTTKVRGLSFFSYCKFSKDEIEDFVKNSKTYADVCRKCGWEPRGDNYKIDSAISSKEIGWLHRL